VTRIAPFDDGFAASASRCALSDGPQWADSRGVEPATFGLSACTKLTAS
jgi:hypothetical protein